MICHLYRDAFSEVYTYRYRVTDTLGNLQLVITWHGLPIADQPDEVFFDDAEGGRLARMTWEDRSWWYGDLFRLYQAAQDTPFAIVEEQWRIVDRLLLRLPGYRLALAGAQFAARGSRYSQHLYELFALPAAGGEDEVCIGEVSHPTSGPTYVLRAEHPHLESDPLLLASIGVILDLWGAQREKSA